MSPAVPTEDAAAAAPSETAIFPRMRLGSRWLNLLWTLPLVAVALLAAFGLTTWLRTLPEVQDFIAEYPGTIERDDPQGFPWWLRWSHWLNVIFLVPIVRAGLQVWAGRPRAYWSRPASPGRDWLRIQRAYPAEGGWSMRDDAVEVHRQVGIPGGKRGAGVGRLWHLSIAVFWVANGALFYVLLFATGQWQRTVPTSLDVFPHALSAIIQYASWNFPVQDAWVSYNSVQLLSYFITTFVAAPIAILTGAAHSPVLAKRLPWLNSEVAKSLHLFVLAWFVVFTILHVTLVLITHPLENLNHIILGTNDASPAGLVLFLVMLAVGAVAWALASPLSMKYPNAVQKAGARILGPMNRWF